MKRFILNVGQKIIAVGVVIGFIAAFLAASSQAVVFNQIGRSGTAAITFLVTLAVGIAGVIAAAFVIYLIVDIRDELKSLNGKIAVPKPTEKME